MEFSIAEGGMSSDHSPYQSPGIWNVEDRRRIIRELVVHEDTLTTDRIQALYTLQGFLFASFGLLAGKGFPLAREARVIVTLIAITGFASALTYLEELEMNTKAIAGLLSEWDEVKASCGESTPPKVIGFTATRRRGGPRWLPRRMIPAMFLGVWGIVLILMWSG
jgi:hypothetical protein